MIVQDTLQPLTWVVLKRDSIYRYIYHQILPFIKCSMLVVQGNEVVNKTLCLKGTIGKSSAIFFLLEKKM